MTGPNSLNTPAPEIKAATDDATLIKATESRDIVLYFAFVG